MARGRSGGGGASGMAYNGRGFTYNFGIAVAARTVNQLHLLTGSTLELSGAMYGLSRIASEYTDALKQNTLYFGGQLNTMKALSFAQQKLISGATQFKSDDVMAGMRELAQVGIDARKNFNFISDAAEATGQSFSKFAGDINQAISGNMSGLIQEGLLTERAAKRFQVYAAGTQQRARAIWDFVKGNQALHNAMAENFKTISGQWNRILEGIKMFGQAIMGNPKDPNSLYARVRDFISGIANWMEKHSKTIRKVGAAIGAVFGWVVHQVTEFASFMGKQLGKVFNHMDTHLTHFKGRMYGLLVWLEFWKVHILSFVREHKLLIEGLLAAYLGFVAVKRVHSAFSGIATVLGTILGPAAKAQKALAGVHAAAAGEAAIAGGGLSWDRRMHNKGASAINSVKDKASWLWFGEQGNPNKQLSAYKKITNRRIGNYNQLASRTGDFLPSEISAFHSKAASLRNEMSRVEKHTNGFAANARRGGFAVSRVLGSTLGMVPQWALLAGAAALIATHWKSAEPLIGKSLNLVMSMGHAVVSIGSSIGGWVSSLFGFNSGLDKVSEKMSGIDSLFKTFGRGIDEMSQAFNPSSSNIHLGDYVQKLDRTATASDITFLGTKWKGKDIPDKPISSTLAAMGGPAFYAANEAKATAYNLFRSQIDNYKGGVQNFQGNASNLFSVLQGSIRDAYKQDPTGAKGTLAKVLNSSYKSYHTRESKLLNLKGDDLNTEDLNERAMGQGSISDFLKSNSFKSIATGAGIPESTYDAIAPKIEVTVTINGEVTKENAEAHGTALGNTLANKINALNRKKALVMGKKPNPKL